MANREVPARWKGTPAEPYWMNEEKCCALVKKMGSFYAAGREIGVSGSLIQRWSSSEFRESVKRKNREKLLNDAEYANRRREYNRKYGRERYRNDPEFADRMNKYAKERYANNTELIKQQQKEKYANDPVFRAKQAIRDSRTECRQRIAAKKRKLELLNEELLKCVESLT